MKQPTSWQPVSQIKWCHGIILGCGIITLYLCTKMVTISSRGPPNLLNLLFERQKCRVKGLCKWVMYILVSFPWFQWCFLTQFGTCTGSQGRRYGLAVFTKINPGAHVHNPGVLALAFIVDIHTCMATSPGGLCQRWWHRFCVQCFWWEDISKRKLSRAYQGRSHINGEGLSQVPLKPGTRGVLLWGGQHPLIHIPWGLLIVLRFTDSLKELPKLLYHMSQYPFSAIDPFAPITCC